MCRGRMNDPGGVRPSVFHLPVENFPAFACKRHFSTACFPGERAVFPFPGGELWKLLCCFLTFYLKIQELSPVFHPVFHSFNRVFHHSTVDNSVESVENLPPNREKPHRCRDFSIRSKSIHMRFMFLAHAIRCKE